MDKNFQTSFIPKKPSVEPIVTEKVSIGIFGFIGIAIFVISTALAVGVYFYDTNLAQELASKQAQLNNAKNTLESPLIGQAKILGRRITDANQILTNHIIVSPIFQALQLNTLKSVQFNNFSYSTPSDPTGKIKVEMTGIARDYTSIALESDQLAKNKDIQNPIFSGLALDPATGNVSFTFNFSVDPELVNFSSHVADYQDQTTATSGSSTVDISNQSSNNALALPQ